VKPWNQRTLYRALLATAIAVLGTLKASIGEGLDNSEIVDLVTVALVSFGAWYGIGAIPGSPTEPFLNNKTPESVEVPIPPADPEPVKP
jgi:hypothetical protein